MKEINSILARASTAKSMKFYLQLQMSVLSEMLIKLVIYREIKKDSVFIQELNRDDYFSLYELYFTLAHFVYSFSWACFSFSSITFPGFPF